MRVSHCDVGMIPIVDMTFEVLKKGSCKIIHCKGDFFVFIDERAREEPRFVVDWANQQILTLIEWRHAGTALMNF